MYAFLTLTIRPRDTETLFDFSLGEDGKLFANLDAVETGIDDGGAGIFADFSHEFGEVGMSFDTMHDRNAEGQADGGFLADCSVRVFVEMLTQMMLGVADDGYNGELFLARIFLAAIFLYLIILAAPAGGRYARHADAEVSCIPFH
jgi:hypothetical protein